MTKPLMQAIDIPAAFGLLTRIPVRVNSARATARGALAAWAFPVVGGVVGAISGGLGMLAISLGTGSEIAAALALACGTILTGAMHEDGLADSADGLWGGWTVEQRLEIMKDSRTGVYGVLAVLFSILIRWSALAALPVSVPLWAVLAASGALSRAGVVAIWALLRPARPDGLAASAGRPRLPTTLIAIISGLLIGLATLGPSSVIGGLAVALAIGGLACVAKRKINGQTGDILGAAQQVGETSMLVVVVIGLA